MLSIWPAPGWAPNHTSHVHIFEVEVFRLTYLVITGVRWGRLRWQALFADMSNMQVAAFGIRLLAFSAFDQFTVDHIYSYG